MRTTALLALPFTFVVALLAEPSALANGNYARFVGAWMGSYLFCTLIPGVLGYLVGGRKKNWNKNDRWFLIVSIVLYLLNFLSVLGTRGRTPN